VIVDGRECVELIDVSRWQETINWDQVDCDGAFIKASGGDAGLYVDSQFGRNAAGCRIPWGAYHFCSHGRFDPVKEADFFVNTIQHKRWTLPPVLDWEPNGPVNNSGAWIASFMARVEERLSVRPILYTGAYVSLDRTAALLKYDLWLAWYTSTQSNPNPTRIPLPGACAPWGRNWSIWQFTGDGRCSGIRGPVDRNVATAEWFKRAQSPTTQGGWFEMATKEELREVIASTMAPVVDSVVQQFTQYAKDTREYLGWPIVSDGEREYLITVDGVGKLRKEHLSPPRSAFLKRNNIGREVVWTLVEPADLEELAAIPDVG
jgi:GH25 family lysozyme M1 (1,4-beta-N-acetylmuramidase)